MLTRSAFRPRLRHDPHLRPRLGITRRGWWRVRWCQLAHQHADTTFDYEAEWKWRADELVNQRTGEEIVAVMPIDQLVACCAVCRRPLEVNQILRLDRAERVDEHGNLWPL